MVVKRLVSKFENISSNKKKEKQYLKLIFHTISIRRYRGIYRALRLLNRNYLDLCKTATKYTMLSCTFIFPISMWPFYFQFRDTWTLVNGYRFIRWICTKLVPERLGKWECLQQECLKIDVTFIGTRVITW